MENSECVPSGQKSISSLFVGQPDVDGPGVETVEEHRPDLQLGAGVVHGLDLVGAGQVHTYVGKRFAGNFKLFFRQISHLLLHGLLFVDSAEATLLHHLLCQRSTPDYPGKLPGPEGVPGISSVVLLVGLGHVQHSQPGLG